MASLNQLAFDLLSIVRPQLSDDSDIDIRQIKFWINNQRALFIRNELNKNRTVDDEIQQTLCADVEVVNASDCCDVTLPCEEILRITKKLPPTIELHNKSAITRVAPIGKAQKPFSFVDYTRIPWVGNGRFNTNIHFAFLHDSYIYIVSNDPKHLLLENVSIRGVFEDPTEAAAFKDCSNTSAPCYTDDSEYPLKAWMIPALKESILKSNLLMAAQAEVSADASNNAKSDIKPA